MMKHVCMQVLCSESVKGGSQEIYFVSSLDEISKTSIKKIPDVDYTIAYFNGRNSVNVRWENHAAPIMLCGSAAYGISDYLLTKYKLDVLNIQAPEINLFAKRDNNKALLSLPCEQIIPIESNYLNLGSLYHDRKSGIYFILLDSRESLESIEWNDEDIYQLPLNNPHGLSLFYWDTASGVGYVRYFTPWYGRSEDSVTGSIQRYLTPFVGLKFGIKNQRWYQLSKNGGLINTFHGDKFVELHGNCLYLTE